MTEDLKTTLTRLRAEIAEFDSYFMAHRPDGRHTVLSAQLQMRISDLLGMIQTKDGDEHALRLAYEVGIAVGELKRIRVDYEVSVAKRVAAGKRESEKSRRKGYEEHDDKIVNEFLKVQGQFLFDTVGMLGNPDEDENDQEEWGALQEWIDKTWPRSMVPKRNTLRPLVARARKEVKAEKKRPV